MKRIIFSNCYTNKRLNSISCLVKRNLSMCCLCLSLIAGVIIGALSAKNADDSTLINLDFLFNSNLNIKVSQTVGENFVVSFSSHFVFILASFLMGLSAWGFLTIPLIVLFRGFGTGLSGGYLCARYGIIGFSFNSFVLLPGILLSSITLLIMARESINFSVGMSAKFLNIKFLQKYDKSTTLKVFFIRTGVVLIMTLAASLLDVLLTNVFSGFFNFNGM